MSYIETLYFFLIAGEASLTNQETRVIFCKYLCKYFLGCIGKTSINIILYSWDQ